MSDKNEEQLKDTNEKQTENIKEGIESLGYEVTPTEKDDKLFNYDITEKPKTKKSTRKKKKNKKSSKKKEKKVELPPEPTTDCPKCGGKARVIDVPHPKRIRKRSVCKNCDWSKITDYGKSK